MMGDDGDHNTGGLVGTAARLVNAIPAVCAAPPGLLSVLDLPADPGSRPARVPAASIVTVTLLAERTGAALPWCGRPFEPTPGAGRPRQYCKRSCRQRDYEARRRAAELGLGEDELIVTRQELERAPGPPVRAGRNRQRRRTDLTDDEADDERRLLNVLLYAAKQATCRA